jgi:hypothetical protein
LNISASLTFTRACIHWGLHEVGAAKLSLSIRGARSRFNLSNTVVLLFDPNPMGMSILAQIITGLGAKNTYRCSTVSRAKGIISQFEVDLTIVDSVSQSGEGYEFVQWLRRAASEPNRHAPVLQRVRRGGRSPSTRSARVGPGGGDRPRPFAAPLVLSGRQQKLDDGATQPVLAGLRQVSARYVRGRAAPQD